MKRPLVVLFVAFVVLGSIPGTAVAATETGDVVVVQEGETVDSLTTAAGTVIVRGTVDGDLTAFAGNVRIEESGTVNGDATVMAGNVRITGTVGGDVTALAGNVRIEEAGTVNGSFQAAAGDVAINGTVEGDATVGAGQLSLGPTASIAGDLEYDAGSFDRAPGATVAGSVRQVESVDITGGPLAPSWVTSLYGFLTSLLLGAVLLLAFPVFSNRVADRLEADPLTSGGIGLAALILGPILIVLLAITIIGIPLAILGAVLFGLLLWIGTVYGVYGVSRWLLSFADVESKWVALLFGLLIVALISPVPLLGGIVQFLLLLLGLGALLLTLRHW